MNERMQPHSIDAEKGALGSLIIDPEAIMEVADFLEVEHFYRDTHRTIYAVILSLYAQQVPADFITMCDVLEQQGKLALVGGPGYITDLINIVPTSGNLVYYAKIIESKAIMRQLGRAAGTIASLAYSTAGAEQALNDAEQAIYEIGAKQAHSDFVEDAPILDEFILKLINMRENTSGMVGLPTGFTDIDHCLGGFQSSDLIILAARPGMGKSALSMSIARHVTLKEKKDVAIFSLEMSKEQLIQRALSMDSGVPLMRIRNNDIMGDEWDKIMQARENLSTHRLFIDDTAKISLPAMRSRLRRLFKKHRPALIIVDYLQLVTTATSATKDENRVQVIDEITADLKAIAKEFNVPVLALAQLSRAVETRQVKVPQLSDLRESGSIEQNADIVMFIYRDEVYNPDTERKGTADIIIAKHRNGPTGEIVLHYDGPRTRFDNYEAPVTPEVYA